MSDTVTVKCVKKQAVAIIDLLSGLRDEAPVSGDVSIALGVALRLLETEKKELTMQESM